MTSRAVTAAHEDKILDTLKAAPKDGLSGAELEKATGLWSEPLYVALARMEHDGRYAAAMASAIPPQGPSTFPMRCPVKASGSISNVLAERRMSQSDLAQAVGKSPAYTNQTMTGRKHASPEWVNLVAETLNLSPKERVVLHRAAAKDQGYEIDLGVYKPKKRR